jgi:hypothetical protein
MSFRKSILAASAAAACVLLGTSGAAGVAVAAPPHAAGFRAGPGFPAGRGFAPAAGPPTSAECLRALGVACYSPLQVERAYDLQSLYARGFDGHGRTIVIVDPFGSPTIRRDLATFDDAFGLPAPPSFRVLQPVGLVPPNESQGARRLADSGCGGRRQVSTCVSRALSPDERPCPCR